MQQLPFAVDSNYREDATVQNQWNRYDQLPKRRQRMHIPSQRPESPYERLGQAGDAYMSRVNPISEQVVARAGSMILQQAPMLGAGSFSYATDRALAQGNQVTLGEVNQLRTQRPGLLLENGMLASGGGQAYPQHQQNNGWQDVNPQMGMMGHQMARQQAQNTLAQGMRSYQQSQIPQHSVAMQSQIAPTPMCRLMEGVEFYRPLQTGGFMQGAVNLCRIGGNVPGNWMVEWELRGVKVCYVVPLNEQNIDIGRIQANPQLQTRLVEVASPMIGVILVPEHAIAGNRGPQQQQYGNRQLMNDSMQNGRRPQQQMGPYHPQQYQQPQVNVNVQVQHPNQQQQRPQQQHQGAPRLGGLIFG